MNDWKPRMQKTVRHLAEQLAGVRTGTISIGFIETVRVNQQGCSVPIRDLGIIKPGMPNRRQDVHPIQACV
jgi:ribosome recycling factor